MSEYSTLECDGCGLEVIERGRAPVDPPEGWVRWHDLDYCPRCTERPAAAAPAPTTDEE